MLIPGVIPVLCDLRSTALGKNKWKEKGRKESDNEKTSGFFPVSTYNPPPRKKTLMHPQIELKLRSRKHLNFLHAVPKHIFSVLETERIPKCNELL